MQSRLVSTLAAALLPAISPQVKAQSQTPAATPSPLTFDVVSVKENPGPDYRFIGVNTQPDGLDANASLKQLLAEAFGVRQEFVSCKLPLCDKPVYEIRAKVAQPDQARFSKLSWQEKNQLLQTVLKERFGLAVHTEARPTNVYDLVIAKGGSKLKRPPADPASDKSGTRGPNGMVYIFTNQFRGFAIDLTTFVDILSQFVGKNLGRPVIDKTGLTGLYDVELKWSDPVHPAGNDPKADATDPGENNPGIFAALPEQLGLELKPARDPEPILVVDQAHTPTPD